MIIWLVGPSGAGKTTVGRRVAALRDCEFNDVDEMIQHRSGRSIEEIFSSGGEKEFRRHEWNEIIELSDDSQARVVALGAGAVADPAVRQLIRETGVRVFIDVDKDTAIARLRNGDPRPMLGDEMDASWQRLYDSRHHAYADADVTVDGTSALDDVARAICAAIDGLDDPLWSIDTTIDGAQTSVESFASALSVLKRARAHVGDRRCVVVTDVGIASDYGELLSDPTRGLGPFLAIESGEGSKSFAAAERLVRSFASAGLQRSDVVVAFGGGVVTDLAGFAASIYMRGIDVILIPTTLLAQVDAAIGGKTAIDVGGVRNLAGTIHQPRHVLMSSALLHTLPAREIRSGFVESLKMGIANSAELDHVARDASPHIVEGNIPPNIDKVVRLSVQTKLDVVRRDSHDRDVRLSLNFGHTFGHALESVEPGRHTHGEAVAFGIACASTLAASVGAITQRRCDDILQNVLPFAAHVGPDHDVASIINAMYTDKKRAGAALRLILPAETTGIIVHDTNDREAVAASIERVCALIGQQ